VDEKGEQIKDKIVYQDIVSDLACSNDNLDDLYIINAKKAFRWASSPSIRHVYKLKKDLLR
jgi:hypothetical protein